MTRGIIKLPHQFHIILLRPERAVSYCKRAYNGSFLRVKRLKPDSYVCAGGA
jgi:hypothetical protein